MFREIVKLELLSTRHIVLMNKADGCGSWGWFGTFHHRHLHCVGMTTDMTDLAKISKPGQMNPNCSHKNAIQYKHHITLQKLDDKQVLLYRSRNLLVFLQGTRSLPQREWVRPSNMSVCFQCILTPSLMPSHFMFHWGNFSNWNKKLMLHWANNL